MLASMVPVVRIVDSSSKSEAFLALEVQNAGFAAYNIYRRSLSTGQRDFERVATLINNNKKIITYHDSGLQVGQAAQFTVVGVDAAGNTSSAYISDVVEIQDQGPKWLI